MERNTLTPIKAIVLLPGNAVVVIPGVFSMLLGEALALGSTYILLWCAVFFVLNHFYFILSEEPGLEKRFGAEYLAYKREVPRWIPRLTPRQGPHSGG